MNENMDFVEMMAAMGEAGIDLHQIFCLSEIEDGKFPVKYWAEGMDGPIMAGYIPLPVLDNIKTLVDDPEAQEFLGLNSIEIESVGAEEG